MYDDGKLSAIRNSDGLWINIEPFKEAAIHYKKYGYYISDPWGTHAWVDYWKEQRRRCIEGYEVSGAKITGDHYFYLNFCPILKVEDAHSKKSKKVKDFPDFWDGDYNYFWVREIARNGISKKDYDKLKLYVKIEEDDLKGGYNLIVGKSRRKGYSYKAAAIAAKNFFTKPNSLTLLNAYDKKYLYPKGIFTMSNSYINFINSNTGWATPSDVVNQPNSGHIKASYIQYQNGIKIEKGFMSEIMSLTFKDNPDAARGKDADEVFFEESGAFGTPGLLKSSYIATQDCVMAGAIKTGMITIFGTSGDMGGGTADYAYMFKKPEAFGLLPFKNVWDNNSEKQKVGFFHPINWNMEGFYDDKGNSNFIAAKKIEIDERERLIKRGATSSEIQKRMQEKPLGPSEAFATVSTNTFPVVELKEQLRLVEVNNWQKLKSIPIDLIYKDGVVEPKTILDNSKEPITSIDNLPEDIRGCINIYEQPIDNIPKGLYKIGYDPIRQDEGSSLAAIIVYKGTHLSTTTRNIIVAEYIGRLESPDDIDRVAMKLAEFYNTTIMHENEVTGVKNFFRRIKRLDLLAQQPDAVISKSIKKSKVSRVYGCHMTVQLKDAGERYIKEWLLDVCDYDEHNKPIMNYQKIYSKRLLEELINYNRDGNFDLVSALIMCMFQVQEEDLNKEYDSSKKNTNATKLLEMMKSMYKN